MSRTSTFLRQFFSTASMIARFQGASKQKTNRLLAEDFSVMPYIFKYAYHRENILSDMVAALLDPRGAHGQGGAFLRCLLRYIGWDKEVSGQCRVMREAAAPGVHADSSRRRMDILVEDAEWSLAMEVKIWADEQEKQLDDYYAYLCRMRGLSPDQGENRVRLVFLTVSGQNGVSGPGVPLGALVRMAYTKEWVKVGMAQKKVADDCGYYFDTWLEDCIHVCAADKVRWFLRDLQNFPSTYDF